MECVSFIKKLSLKFFILNYNRNESKIFSFLSCKSEGYIFFTFLSSSKWLLMASAMWNDLDRHIKTLICTKCFKNALKKQFSINQTLLLLLLLLLLSSIYLLKYYFSLTSLVLNLSFLSFINLSFILMVYLKGFTNFYQSFLLFQILDSN